MIETEAERRALADIWGDRLVLADGQVVRGQYDENRLDAVLVEGASRSFLAYKVDLDAAGVTVGADGVSVETHDGRTLPGPYRLKSIPDSEADGAYLRYALELQ